MEPITVVISGSEGRFLANYAWKDVGSPTELEPIHIWLFMSVEAIRENNSHRWRAWARQGSRSSLSSEPAARIPIPPVWLACLVVDNSTRLFPNQIKVPKVACIQLSSAELWVF